MIGNGVVRLVACLLLAASMIAVAGDARAAMQDAADDTVESYTNIEPKTIRTESLLKDPELRVESRKLGLRRTVEMLQWDRQNGEYVKVWSDSPVPDVGFDARHKNPQMPSLRNAVWLAGDATIDGIPVEDSVLMALGQWISIRPSFRRVPYRWSLRFEPDGDGLSDSDNPLEPKVGDVRLTWSEMFVPTLERQVVLANGVWQLPENVQLDEATRTQLIREREASESRVSWNDMLIDLWWKAALTLLVGLVAFRQNGSLPLHEVMQATVVVDDLETRTQIQMERIAENDLRTEITDLLGQHPLNRAVGSHRHKRRGFHNTAGKRQSTTTCATIGAQQFKTHAAHALASGNSSIASPYEKNRYFCSIACRYACMMRSNPENADTIISKVLSGKWKLVIIASTDVMR